MPLVAPDPKSLLLKEPGLKPVGDNLPQLIDVPKGSILNLSDGTYCITLENIHKSGRLARVVSDGVQEVSSDRLLLSGLQVSGIDPGAVDRKFSGRGGKILVTPRWLEVSPDDLLQHQDGRRELVLTIAPASNATQFRVTSLVRMSDGELLLNKDLRSDLELASTIPIQVIKVELEDEVIGHQRTTSRSQLSSINKDPELCSLDGAIEIVQRKLAEAVVKKIDNAIQSNSSQESIDQLQLLYTSQLEKAQTAFANYRLGLMQALSTIRALDYKQGESERYLYGMSATAEKVETAEQIHKLFRVGIIDRLSQTALTARGRSATIASFLDKHLDYIKDVTQLILGSEPNTEMRFFTHLESDKAMTDLPLLKRLAEIADQSQQGNNDLSILSGGIVWSDYSISRFQDIIKKGGEIVTLRERDDAGNNSVVGFMTYFPPSYLPENQQKRFALFHADQMPAAYIDMICVAPSARTGRFASEMLHKAHFLHLIRERAQFSITEIHQNNIPAHGMAHRQGAIFDPLSGVRSVDGDKEYNWNTVILPVSSNAIRVSQELAEKKPFAKTLIGAGIIRSGILSSLPAIDRENMEKFYLKMCSAKAPIVVRLTGFSGNMPQQEQGWREIFTEALAGAQGSYIVGGTESLQTIDGELTPITRKDIVATPDLVRDSSPNMQVGYIIVEPPTGITKFSSPVVDDGSQLEVIDGLSSIQTASGHLATNPWVTIVNRKANQNNSFRTSGRTDKIWLEEANWALQVAELVRAESKIFTDSIKPVLVVYGGGQTSQNEIKMWAEKGHEVVLIKGSGGACDKTLADVDWMAKFGSRIHVVENGSQLRAKLTEFGEEFTS